MYTLTLRTSYPVLLVPLITTIDKKNVDRVRRLFRLFLDQPGETSANSSFRNSKKNDPDGMVDYPWYVGPVATTRFEDWLGRLAESVEREGESNEDVIGRSARISFSSTGFLRAITRIMTASYRNVEGFAPDTRIRSQLDKSKPRLDEARELIESEHRAQRPHFTIDFEVISIENKRLLMISFYIWSYYPRNSCFAPSPRGPQSSNSRELDVDETFKVMVNQLHNVIWAAWSLILNFGPLGHYTPRVWHFSLSHPLFFICRISGYSKNLPAQNRELDFLLQRLLQGGETYGAILQGRYLLFKKHVVDKEQELVMSRYILMYDAIPNVELEANSTALAQELCYVEALMATYASKSGSNLERIRQTVNDLRGSAFTNLTEVRDALPYLHEPEARGRLTNILTLALQRNALLASVLRDIEREIYDSVSHVEAGLASTEAYLLGFVSLDKMVDLPQIRDSMLHSHPLIAEFSKMHEFTQNAWNAANAVSERVLQILYSTGTYRETLESSRIARGVLWLTALVLLGTFLLGLPPILLSVQGAPPPNQLLLFYLGSFALVALLLVSVQVRGPLVFLMRIGRKVPIDRIRLAATSGNLLIVLKDYELGKLNPAKLLYRQMEELNQKIENQEELIREIRGDPARSGEVEPMERYASTLRLDRTDKLQRLANAEDSLDTLGSFADQVKKAGLVATRSFSVGTDSLEMLRKRSEFALASDQFRMLDPFPFPRLVLLQHFASGRMSRDLLLRRIAAFTANDDNEAERILINAQNWLNENANSGYAQFMRYLKEIGIKLKKV